MLQSFCMITDRKGTNWDGLISRYKRGMHDKKKPMFHKIQILNDHECAKSFCFSCSREILCSLFVFTSHLTILKVQDIKGNILNVRESLVLKYCHKKYFFYCWENKVMEAVLQAEVDDSLDFYCDGACAQS